MSSGTNFDCCASKLQKINVKHSQEKPLIDFVNLSAIFSSRLSAKFKREVFYEFHLPIPLVKVSLLIIIFSENSSLILTCFFNYTLARKEIANFEHFGRFFSEAIQVNQDGEAGCAFQLVEVIPVSGSYCFIHCTVLNDQQDKR